MIKSIRIAYAIGFSSALNYGAYSAYREAAKYNFGEELRKSNRMVRAFNIGFAEGSKLSMLVRRENEEPVYNFLEPEHQLLFS